jgi:hypothetical protein
LGINTKKCLICKGGKKNDCLHWHRDPKSGDIWVYCVGVCQRAYSIRSYCWHAGIQLNEFLKGDFNFEEARPNEVNKIEFPKHYLTMSDPRSKKGVEYVVSRGLRVEGDMYYDSVNEGIVFPYYYENTFVGAQTRFIEPRVWKDGTVQKMDTIPGTRLGLIFYNWNQAAFVTNIKAVVITEGAFDALAIQQSLVGKYGGISKCPWRVMACSGAGATKHHVETIKELKDRGFKVVLAPDSDEAGLKMLKKFKDADAITHYCLTMNSEVDWNSKLLEVGHEGFAEFFIKNIKSVI